MPLHIVIKRLKPLKHENTKKNGLFCFMKEIKAEIKNILPIPRDVESIGSVVVDSAYKVHKHLGPGVLEKIYEAC